MLLFGMALVIWVAACTDERTSPVAPEQPSYNETQLILDRVSSNGQEVTGSFELRDEVMDGNLILFCFIQPDADAEMIDQLAIDIELLEAANDSISALIFDRWSQGNLTPEDSIDLENIKSDYNDQIGRNRIVLDSLDTWVDDRFKISIWLDDDATPKYPLAVFLDQNTTINDTTTLDYLGDSTIVWGQGNYLTETDDDGWRGKRIELDLEEFWVADPTWQHPVKPERDVFLQEPASYPDRYTSYELLPVRDWLERMTPGVTHTLHVRVGSAGTVTEVSASLYLVYGTAE